MLSVSLNSRDVLHRHELLIRHRDAHDRHREQARFVLQVVRPRKGRQQKAQRDGVLQLVGNPESPQHKDEQRRCGQPDEGAEKNRLPQRRQHHARDHVRPRGHADRLEDQQRQQRADRVNDNSLPSQQRPDRPHRANVPQHRPDDRRPRDDQDRAEQNRQRPRHAQNEVRRDRGDQPRHADAGRAERRKRPADVPQLGQVQRQAPFEQDDRNRQRHDREDQLAEDRAGIDQFVSQQRLRRRSDRNAREQEEENCGDLQARREPLPANPQHGHAGDADELRFLVGHCVLRPVRGCAPLANEVRLQHSAANR